MKDYFPLLLKLLCLYLTKKFKHIYKYLKNSSFKLSFDMILIITSVPLQVELYELRKLQYCYKIHILWQVNAVTHIDHCQTWRCGLHPPIPTTKGYWYNILYSTNQPILTVSLKFHYTNVTYLKHPFSYANVKSI